MVTPSVYPESQATMLSSSSEPVVAALVACSVGCHVTSVAHSGGKLSFSVSSRSAPEGRNINLWHQRSSKEACVIVT